MLHLVIHFFERAANNVSNIRPEDDLLNVEVAGVKYSLDNVVTCKSEFVGIY